MKIHALIISFAGLLCAACMPMDQRLFVPRATAPGESNSTIHFRFFGKAGRKVDHSAIWQVHGFGQEAYFPVHKNFAFHSSALGNRLVTMSWTGWNERGEEEPTEFSAGLIDNSVMLHRLSLDAVVADAVEKEAVACKAGYQRRSLAVTGDARRAEMSYCSELKFKAAQEIALHVYIDKPPVIFTGHWVRRVPLSSPVDLDDQRLLRRIDGMNEVVFCQTADANPEVMCKHLRTLYVTGDRLYNALHAN